MIALLKLTKDNSYLGIDSEQFWMDVCEAVLMFGFAIEQDNVAKQRIRNTGTH